MQRLKVLVTGTTSGIGRATAEKFLKEGHIVYGIDIRESTIENDNYTHYIADVRDVSRLPNIENINILINNAGSIKEEEALDTNIKGYINVAEKYCFQPDIKAVVNVGSGCSVTGVDLPFYCASNGARNSYTINLANRLGELYKVPVNLVGLELVETDFDGLFNHPEKVEEVKKLTLLERSMTLEDASKWIYFLAVENKNMTGQCIMVDNGESIKHHFVDYRD